VSSLDATADELARLSAALREAGETEWRKQVTQGIKDAADGIPDAIRAGMKPHLPNRYADVLAKDTRLTISVKTGITDPGVFVVGKNSGKQRKLNMINAGILRHPLFGDRNRWYAQELPSVRPGWFDDPCQAAKPEVRAEIEAALEQVNAIIWAAVHG